MRAEYTSCSRRAWQGCIGDLEDSNKSSITKLFLVGFLLICLPLLIVQDAWHWLGNSFHNYYVRFGIAGILIPIWCLTFAPLVGWAVWYYQPAQKHARYVRQVISTEDRLISKQREITSLLARYEQELQILQGKPEENRDEITHNQKRIEELRNMNQKLTAGMKELASIRTEAEEHNEFNRIFDRKEIERLQDSIEDIIQNNSQNPGGESGTSTFSIFGGRCGLF